MKHLSIFMFVLIILTGCWDSQELDDVVLVQGVGLSLGGEKKDKINLIVEIIKPVSQSRQNAGSSEGQGNGQQIVLEHEADTTLEAARQLIAFAKRRLSFEHARIFIIHRDLAEREHFARILDTVRRDKMLRTNSYLFVTNQDPMDILSTPTLYESLTSNELVSALDQTKFIAEFAPLMIRDFFKNIEGPLPNSYIPMIRTQKNGNQVITYLEGSAIIHEGKMVGTLNERETYGLNFLLDQVNGGTVSIRENDQERVALEINRSKTKIIPKLQGKKLTVEVHTMVEGILADNYTMEEELDQSFFSKLEEKIEKEVSSIIRGTLDKLQDLEADITKIGIKTFQTYPNEWHDYLRKDWDQIFANAEISIKVDATYTHGGLNKQSIYQPKEKPHRNPYRLFMPGS